MKKVENLEQHSSLVKKLKDRASCKVPKTNCFLSPEEIGAYISAGNWEYEETQEAVYFFNADGTAVHLYYYAAKDLTPELELESALPIMADFVLRQKEVAIFEGQVLPLWEKSGFALYKKYQRMRCRLQAGLPKEPSPRHTIALAQEGQAEELRALWEACLDQMDNSLPSKDETMMQIQEGNIVCCLEHGKVCGAVFAEVKGRSGFIQHVAVYEGCRGKAVGEQMMKHLYSHMSQRGITDLKLWVDVENVAAIKLYKKCGFETDGVYSAKLLKG